MGDIYMLQNNLKEQPRRCSTYIQEKNPSITQQKITSKY